MSFELNGENTYFFGWLLKDIYIYIYILILFSWFCKCCVEEKDSFAWKALGYSSRFAFQLGDKKLQNPNHLFYMFSLC